MLLLEAKPNRPNSYNLLKRKALLPGTNLVRGMGSVTEPGVSTLIPGKVMSDQSHK